MHLRVSDVGRFGYRIVVECADIVVPEVGRDMICIVARLQRDHLVTAGGTHDGAHDGLLIDKPARNLHKL